VKTHVRLGQAVGADYDIDRPGLEALQNLCLLAARGKTRKRRDFEWKLGHSLAEVAAMLLAQNRGGHQHGHLVAGVDGLERGSHGHLGFAVPHVAAKQPVHRPRLRHVLFDRLDGDELIRRFVIEERSVELTLPLGVVGKSDAGTGTPRGLQVEHLSGQVDDGLLDAFFCRPQIRPPSLASLGRPFAPPTYFCTSPILELGT